MTNSLTAIAESLWLPHLAAAGQQRSRAIRSSTSFPLLRVAPGDEHGVYVPCVLVAEPGRLRMESADCPPGVPIAQHLLLQHPRRDIDVDARVPERARRHAVAAQLAEMHGVDLRLADVHATVGIAMHGLGVAFRLEPGDCLQDDGVHTLIDPRFLEAVF